MEVNRDEAVRCLQLAREKLSQGNAGGAVKFARKSISLYPTSEAKAFLEKALVEESSSNPSATTTASSSSSAASSADSTLRNRSSAKAEASPGRQDRSYTKEQEASVAKIKACRPTAYYEILGVTKEATEVEIKKSYRKLALRFHPDKNSAPGADEAFKMISRAFTVLNDPEKRRHFDRFGEEEGRGMGGDSGMGRDSAAFFRQAGAAGGMDPFAEGDITPEQLFNMFFGGDLGGGGPSPFMAAGGGLGGGGVRFRTFGQRPSTFHGPQARRPATPQQPDSLVVQLLRLLPFLLLLFFFFSPSLFLFSSEPPPYDFVPSARFPHKHTTAKRGIPYYMHDPTRSSYLASAPRNAKKQYDERVERDWGKVLRHRCQSEEELRRSRVLEAFTWYGSKDEEKYNAAASMPMPHCNDYHAYLQS
ncbi:MAG: hypothetical protein DHS80DRAFT_21341 [Piptocephalis tieghemiana]|nr:MAG: hypothetical protein DHS80DRAFT_21341 [Piptocephalis tieghemiana]